jgi:CO/xanthine dehydrogenase FAD-binding subunit
MKPAPFAYFAPTSVDETLALLHEHGYAAKLLAGGQSLIPAMNFRLAQPGALIDLNRVEDLFHVHPLDESEPHPGGLCVGAMTRQRTLERSPLVAQRAPLLHAALPHVAHVQIRNRGTLGGSLAHADPAAELPAVAVALGARLRIRSAQHGDRWADAADFFLGLFTTDLAPDELLVEVIIPAAPPRTGWAFDEFARRAGDYALAGCAAGITLDEAGRCADVCLVYLSVGDVPAQAGSAGAALLGEVPTPERIAEAARAAAHDDIDPPADIHATAAFRRRLAEALARRVLGRAVEKARESLRV